MGRSFGLRQESVRFLWLGCVGESLVNFGLLRVSERLGWVKFHILVVRLV
jgi:hypothetical protein